MQSGEPVTVEGDPELLRRAVENVIRNAIRYAPQRIGGGGLPGAPQRRGDSGCARPGSGRAGGSAAAHFRRFLPRG